MTTLQTKRQPRRVLLATWANRDDWPLLRTALVGDSSEVVLVDLGRLASPPTTDSSAGDRRRQGRPAPSTSPGGANGREQPKTVLHSETNPDPVDDPGPVRYYELPRLAAIDCAVVLVDRSAEELTVDQIGLINHLVGLLQGRLDYGRVVVLHHEGVDAFETIRVTKLAYAKGGLDASLNSILDKIGEIATVQASMRSRRSPSERTRNLLTSVGLDETRMLPEIWLVLGFLVMLFVLAGIIGYQIFADPIGGSANLSPDSENADGAVDDADGAADGSAGASDGVAGPVTSLQSGAAAGPQVGGDEGSVSGLPARCVIETAPEAVVPLEVSCDGVGGVRADGFLGPWHSEISSITVTPGVVGEVFIAAREGTESGTRVRLTPQEQQPLESYDSLFGVDRIELEFSANGQQVHFHQRGDRGGGELVLTFTLDL